LQLPANRATLRAADVRRATFRAFGYSFCSTPVYELAVMTIARDHRIDFFRGLALIFIFWDHVPHNPLGQITLRNFGFSDAAEVFVFLAGYAAVLAYGKVLAREGFLIACVKPATRVGAVRGAHLLAGDADGHRVLRQQPCGNPRSGRGNGHASLHQRPSTGADR
jgi:hypothetical protein